MMNEWCVSTHDGKRELSGVCGDLGHDDSTGDTTFKFGENASISTEVSPKSYARAKKVAR